MACNCLAKVFFNLVLILQTLPVVLIVGINNCIIGCFPGTAGCLQPLNAKITAIGWKLTLMITCCVVSIKKTGADEVMKDLVAKDGKPRLIIFNHLSFFDTILITTMYPLSVVSQTKMMASEHLFRMPLIGTIVKGPGHFKVPFKNQETKKADEGTEPQAPGKKGSVADFSVDKEAVAKVMEQFEEHVRSGKVGAWFPEGRLNPHPKTMQTFRAGGFALATHMDVAIYCGVFAGFEVFWHRKSALGGTPSNCAVHNFKLCDSSFDLVKELSDGKEDLTEKAKCILIANHAQKRMQEERDRLVAEGWVSQLPDDDDNTMATTSHAVQNQGTKTGKEEPLIPEQDQELGAPDATSPKAAAL